MNMGFWNLACKLVLGAFHMFQLERPSRHENPSPKRPSRCRSELWQLRMCRRLAAVAFSSEGRRGVRDWARSAVGSSDDLQEEAQEASTPTS